MLDRQSRPNDHVSEDGIARLDAQAIGAWLMIALARYAGEPVEAIIPVGHGAALAALADDSLAFTPFDYEQALPGAILAAYRHERDPFAATGSPALAAGLNFGAQLYWQQELGLLDRPDLTLLPWAQYWAWLLCGTAVSEVTSLGCHSDLWNPAERAWSGLARRMGWAERFAPLAHAGAAIGTLRPQIAAATGLSPLVRVHAGIHDSNAALLAARAFPGLAEADLTVLSTGTWFVAMRRPHAESAPAQLDESRDCLVNVDPDGKAVPSARFMGGRELELLEARIDRLGLDGLDAVLAGPCLIVPGQVPGCGPFPAAPGGWQGAPASPAERDAAAALYAALMSETMLSLVGSHGNVLVEGRFGRSELFTRALATLRGDLAVHTAAADADVSFGALRLLYPGLQPESGLRRAAPLPSDLTPYRTAWRQSIGQRETC